MLAGEVPHDGVGVGDANVAVDVVRELREDGLGRAFRLQGFFFLDLCVLFGCLFNDQLVYSIFYFVLVTSCVIRLGCQLL